MKMHEEGGSPSAIVLRRLALQATGMTGADIERVVREARQKARRAGGPLTHADLEKRLVGTRPARSPSMRRRIAIHESGHILVRLVYCLGEITFVTIDGRDGHGYVESTMDDTLIQTQEGLTRLLQTFLAGRAAEQVFFGDALAGSGGSERSDLARATHLAYLMEASIGFGSIMPLLYRDVADMQTALRFDPDLATRVNWRLETAHAAACDLVRRHRHSLQHITDALVHHGTLEGADLQAVLTAIESPGSVRPQHLRTAAPSPQNCVSDHRHIVCSGRDDR